MFPKIKSVAHIIRALQGNDKQKINASTGRQLSSKGASDRERRKKKIKYGTKCDMKEVAKNIGNNIGHRISAKISVTHYWQNTGQATCRLLSICVWSLIFVCGVSYV